MRRKSVGANRPVHSRTSMSALNTGWSFASTTSTSNDFVCACRSDAKQAINAANKNDSNFIVVSLSVSKDNQQYQSMVGSRYHGVIRHRTTSELAPEAAARWHAFCYDTHGAGLARNRIRQLRKCSERISVDCDR